MTIDTFLKFKDDEETKDQPVPQDLWAEVKPYVLQAKDGKWCVKWRKLNATCEKMGYFCIRTNCALSAQQSFELYRERGKIEEAFRRFKVTNNCDRLYSTEKTYRGKLFLFLLAESIRCIFGTTARTKCKAAGSKLPGNSLDKLLGKLDGVMLRRKGRGGHIWTPTLISKKQRDAFELLGIPTPAGRMPL